MKVLVLGGTRFIGPPTVRALLHAGHQVTVWHRGQHTAPLPAAVRVLHGDRRQLADHAAVLRAQKPDCVVDTFLHAERAAETVVQVFAGHVDHLIVLSSLDVYRAYARFHRLEPGPPDPTPLFETAPLRRHPFPRRHLADDTADWRYDYDKLLVESVVLRDPAPRATVLRLAYVYGPGDYRDRLRPYVEPMRQGVRRITLGQGRAAWRSSRVYVKTVAAAIVAAVGSPQAAGRVYNVADDEALSEAAWAARIAEVMSWPGEIVVAQDAHGDAAWDFHQPLVLDTERLQQELELHPPVTLMQALDATVRAR